MGESFWEREAITALTLLFVVLSIGRTQCLSAFAHGSPMIRIKSFLQESSVWTEIKGHSSPLLNISLQGQIVFGVIWLLFTETVFSHCPSFFIENYFFFTGISHT